jgi:undecaprenyl diphosphate synthase
MEEGHMNYEQMKVPHHVAIILDGNGRWAEERGLSRSEGHSKGTVNLKKLSEYIFDRGVKVLSVFAFSTENFKRAKQEVSFLMSLMENELIKYKEILTEKGIKIVFSGMKEEPLTSSLIELMNNIEEETASNKKGIINFCVNYGGHAEIVNATKTICELVKDGKLELDEVTENSFAKYLFNDLPPVDLLIRTSGEIRISNFMLYQLSYAEMYFPETHFPAFNEEEFDKAILEYNRRDRRFGGVYEDQIN